jgi:hypothetical protein
VNESPLSLDKNPSGSSESEQFATPDERGDVRAKTHAIELLKQQQGPIGRLIGCADSALTIAFVLLILGGAAILASSFAMIWHPVEGAAVFEKLITFELTVAGYVMGKKSD